MDETTRASCGAHLRINEDRTVTPIPSPSSAAPTLTRERDRWTGRFDTKEIEYGFKGHLEKEGDVPRMPEHRLGLLLNNPDAAWPTLETKDLALDLRDARRVLRQLAATADTISPQEVINVVADALGMDRHQYAGECDPNRSLMDWEIRAKAASPERVREQAIATGSPAACPECGAKFWTPGNLNIAIHADEEWRNGFAERMRHEGREQAIEECARVALSHAAQAGAAAHGAHNRRSDDEETIWCARESEAHGIANSIRALAAAGGAGET